MPNHYDKMFNYSGMPAPRKPMMSKPGIPGSVNSMTPLTRQTGSFNDLLERSLRAQVRNKFQAMRDYQPTEEDLAPIRNGTETYEPGTPRHLRDRLRTGNLSGITSRNSQAMAGRMPYRSPDAASVMAGAGRAAAARKYGSARDILGANTMSTYYEEPEPQISSTSRMMHLAGIGPANPGMPMETFGKYQTGAELPGMVSTPSGGTVAGIRLTGPNRTDAGRRAEAAANAGVQGQWLTGKQQDDAIKRMQRRRANNRDRAALRFHNKQQGPGGLRLTLGQFRDVQDARQKAIQGGGSEGLAVAGLAPWDYAKEVESGRTQAIANIGAVSEDPLVQSDAMKYIRGGGAAPGVSSTGGTPSVLTMKGGSPTAVPNRTIAENGLEGKSPSQIDQWVNDYGDILSPEQLAEIEDYKASLLKAQEILERKNQRAKKKSNATIDSMGLGKHRDANYKGYRPYAPYGGY